MTPQSSFMLLAPIDPSRLAELRRMLVSMNVAPGQADASNALLPFGQFDTLHVARLLIVDDMTLGDVGIYGLPTPTYPRYLAFLGDLDGDPDVFLEQLANRAGEGLRTVFACCEGFTSQTDLLEWMRQRSVSSAAWYANWRGRTVRDVREESSLHDALERYIRSNATGLKDLPPQAIHTALRRFVHAEAAAGRLTLSAERSTPLDWRIANLLHLIGVPLLVLVTLPALFVIAVVFLVRLRILEKTDPELYLRVDSAYSDQLARVEDHDVTNQFSAIGSVAPGMVRRWTVSFVLWIVDYAARHLYTRGRLARVRSIQFARWVWIDDKKRLMFLSNYDGSLESYMDDFINKVGFGLNLAFGNGIGYPRTRWLIFDGCKDERKFKEFLRRHQLPTEVWYKAYPGLTAVDLERNGRIRRGLEPASMSEQEYREWLALL